MKPTCDLVSERVALGEPLGELTEHAASCDACKRTVAMVRGLGAAHHEVDPGLGFAARMTAGAQHLVGVRRRRRLALGLAATVAAGALGVFVITRTPDPGDAPAIAHNPTHDPKEPVNNPEADAAAVRALLDLADVDRSSHLSAHWGRIEKPLRPYRAVLKGLVP